MKNTEEKRPCQVCGARVRNWNRQVKTCDNTCTNAYHSRRTRAQQFAHEMKMEAEREAEQATWEIDLGRANVDLEQSNRPYLSAAYA